MYKHLLISTDGSKLSGKAIRTAVRLARGAFETASEYSWDRRAARLDPILQTATDLR